MQHLQRKTKWQYSIRLVYPHSIHPVRRRSHFHPRCISRTRRLPQSVPKVVPARFLYARHSSIRNLFLHRTRGYYAGDNDLMSAPSLNQTADLFFLEYYTRILKCKNKVKPTKLHFQLCCIDAQLSRRDLKSQQTFLQDTGHDVIPNRMASSDTRPRRQLSKSFRPGESRSLNGISAHVIIIRVSNYPVRAH